jgi:Fe-S cluster assembly protein SufD
VKCSHAATIGQIDEQSMFYLRSRGIDAAAARRIMMHAFVGDILRRIKIEVLKQGLDGLLFPEPESEHDPSAGLAPGGAA